jgi:hypothetical protein
LKHFKWVNLKPLFLKNVSKVNPLNLFLKKDLEKFEGFNVFRPTQKLSIISYLYYSQNNPKFQNHNSSKILFKKHSNLVRNWIRVNKWTEPINLKFLGKKCSTRMIQQQKISRGKRRLSHNKENNRWVSVQKKCNRENFKDKKAEDNKVIKDKKATSNILFKAIQINGLKAIYNKTSLWILKYHISITVHSLFKFFLKIKIISRLLH